ncbi:MAG TPA: hypothetical protein VH333_00875, partial [Pseudonocardiaceae bacterium]|nr:hypothetical protein [Pseudonocardiaceae bacterium]
MPPQPPTGPVGRPYSSARKPPPRSARQPPPAARQAPPQRRAAPKPRRRKRVSVGANPKPRIAIGRILMIAALVLAGIKLIDVQGLQANQLSAIAEKESLTYLRIPAQRGTISDRDGTELAFNVAIRALTAQPKRMRTNWNAPSVALVHKGITYEQHTQTIADELRRLIGASVDEQQVISDLRSDKSFVYLAKSVDPAVAAQITSDFPELGSEVRSEREYPEGTVAANIVGMANWRTDRP